MAFNRRAFIKTVVLGTGATFYGWNDLVASAPSKVLPVRVGFSRLDIGHNDGRRKSATPTKVEAAEYVVVGGGAAGLAAAWELKKAGKEFLIVESEPYLGGVMFNPSPEWRGIRYSLGSTYFANKDSVYKEFLTDLGVHPVETGEDALCFSDRDIVVDPWNPKNINTLPISAVDRAAFREFR